MRNVRAQKLQWSDPTVHSSTVTIVKWQMCNMHERKKMMVIIWF